MPNQFDDRKLIRYLLGGLREGEQDSLEQQYFQDDDLFEYLSALEGELIDRYLKGELSWRERRRFEKHFLATPLRRQRVQSARALMEAVAPWAIRSHRTKFWESHGKILSWSFACAMLVLLAGVSWLAWRNANLQNQLAMARLALQQRARNPQQAAPLAISFTLAPVQRGLGNSNRLIVPAGAQILNFSIEAPASGQPPYRAIFRTPDGDQVGTSTDIITRPLPAGIAVTAQIPAAMFSPGTYILTLQAWRPGSGFADLKSYSFTIAR